MDWQLTGSGTVYEIQSSGKRVALITHATLGNARKMAVADELLALVEAVEWDWDGFCPWCKGQSPEYGGSGHAPDCPRQRTLARAQGQGEQERG